MSRCTPRPDGCPEPEPFGLQRWSRPGVVTVILALMLSLSLTGCSLLLRKTPSPIPTQAAPMVTAERAATLVVFLPGRGGAMVDFEREGFVTTLRESGARVDSIAVDAHLGYYFQRTVIARLQADVLQPARQQGYRRIVLVGVSLGGLGALLCERDLPGSVDALVLLGPYLGKDAGLFDGIRSSGGPAAWAAGRDPQAGGVEEQIWTFLGTQSAVMPPTWLLCGRRDSLAPGHRLLAGLLPPNRVAIIDGAHDWPTWCALWRDLCLHSDLFQAEKSDGVPRPLAPAAITP